MREPPPLHVRQREPLHEFRQIAILPRPENKVEMIRHRTVCEKIDGVSQDRIP
jgi:hypothetical protein